MGDIFDLSEIEINLRKEINKPKSIDQLILNLFELKDPLTIDHIIVGLYRKHNYSMRRKIVIQHMWHLSKKKLVKRVRGCRGVYNKIKKFEKRKIHQKKEIYRVCESMAREFTSRDIKNILELSPKKEVRCIDLAYISHVFTEFVKEEIIAFIGWVPGSGSPRHYKFIDKQ